MKQFLPARSASPQLLMTLSVLSSFSLALPILLVLRSLFRLKPPRERAVKSGKMSSTDLTEFVACAGVVGLIPVFLSFKVILVLKVVHTPHQHPIVEFLFSR